MNTMQTITRILMSSSEMSSRVLVSGLFLALAFRLGGDFIQTHRPTDLLLLVGEALVVVLTCLRRPAQVVDRRMIVRFVTTVSMLSPLMIRPSQNPAIMSELAAASMASLGLAIVVAGKLSLGYSFGLLPANRGIIVRGLYRIVRHPIYLGYLLTHIPFLAAHPSGWNLVVLLAGDTALVARALYEEQTLKRDPQYVQYCQTVKWRLVPGVC
jgi:protein-S-isoprenylcysteine O-methyltransferase Ste14